MLNLVAFVGRLTADPELRTTPNGVSVTSFSIAVDRPFQRSGADRQTDFFDIVAWRNTAEFITRFFHKGNLICVQGYMTTRTYTDKNGVNRKVYEMIAENAHFCESKRDAAASASSQQAPSSNQQPMSYASGDTGDFVEISDDDDLPF